MLLSSSLVPTGPKSKGHFLVLNHDNERDLIRLPKSYPDLKKQVQKLYHVDTDRFHIETKELNVCAGERIRIPEELWDDVAELLGNVYVVPSNNAVIDSHPESAPEPEGPSALENPVPNTRSGVLNLDIPLTQTEVVVINVGNVDFAADPIPSTEFSIQLLDEQKNVTLAMTISPHKGTTTLASSTNKIIASHPLQEAFPSTSGHHFIICKNKTRFSLLFDSGLIGIIDAPAHTPLTSITYDLGTKSPFEGPASTNVYSNVALFCREFGPYNTISTPLDKGRLYQQISESNPRSAGQLSKALDNIRKEITTFNHSTSGTKWSHRGITIGQWTDFGWYLHPQSIFVMRYYLNKAASSDIELHFRSDDISRALDIALKSADRTAHFAEHNSKGAYESYHTVKLAHSMHATGSHSVALTNNRGQLNILFDFRQSAVVTRSTMVDKKPRYMRFLAPEGAKYLEADVYEFGN